MDHGDAGNGYSAFMTPLLLAVEPGPVAIDERAQRPDQAPARHAEAAVIIR